MEDQSFRKCCQVYKQFMSWKHKQATIYVFKEHDGNRVVVYARTLVASGNFNGFINNSCLGSMNMKTNK